VIWVEALPDVYEKLKVHLEKYPRSMSYCACVSDRDGDEVAFHVANNEAQSSSMLEFGTHAKEHPGVMFTKDVLMRTRRVDSLLRNCRFEGDWFLNVDLQGAELLALKGMGELLRRIKYAYIEVNDHELYRGCPLTGDIDQYLAQFGFVGKEVQMTRHGWGDKFYIRES
jgi:FkbM family methyltransferase